MNKKNTYWFKIISISLPFVLILVVELLLRIFDVGDNLDLFIEHPKSQEYRIFNSKVSRRYFVNKQNATSGYSEPFKKEKDSKTFRIFVQGGSTAFGFPYENNGSFHRMLQYQFNINYPERNIEVINLSLTAVNSYTLLDFADEIIENEPDAVLIYAGHNEFYGALGVGSTSKLGLNPTLVRLGIQFRRSRLGNLLSNLIYQTSGGESSEVSANLMTRMVAEQSIKKNSKLYEKGIEQFNLNTSLLLSKYQKNHVPVFIGTLVSNLKDQPPFVSDSSHNENADYYYQKGKQAEEEKDYNKAHRFYTLAKDEDLLRFRAPEEINENIKSLADQYEAVLVPVDKEFNLYAQNGLIGKELMLEHLHPNLKGYYALSTSFFKSLIQHLRFEKDTDQLPLIPFEDLPLTQMDSIFGEYRISILRSQWPFNEALPNFSLAGKNVPEVMAGGLIDKKITWVEAMERLNQYFNSLNDNQNLLKVAESVALAYPLNHYHQLNAGEVSFSQAEYYKAFVYYRKSFNQAPDLSTLIKCVTAGLYNKDFVQVTELLSDIEPNNLSAQTIDKIKMDVQSIMKLEEKIKADDENSKLLEELAVKYSNYGIDKYVLIHANKLLSLNPDNTVANELIKNIDISNSIKSLRNKQSQQR